MKNQPIENRCERCGDQTEDARYRWKLRGIYCEDCAVDLDERWVLQEIDHFNANQPKEV